MLQLYISVIFSMNRKNTQYLVGKIIFRNFNAMVDPQSHFKAFLEYQIFKSKASVHP